MITMYGIPNCDTVKKARVWLDQHGVAYDFHDYKKAGVDAGRLGQWVDEHGWETVLNRAGTTFKKLPTSRPSTSSTTPCLVCGRCSGCAGRVTRAGEVMPPPVQARPAP